MLVFVKYLYLWRQNTTLMKNIEYKKIYFELPIYSYKHFKRRLCRFVSWVLGGRYSRRNYTLKQLNRLINKNKGLFAMYL